MGSVVHVENDGQFSSELSEAKGLVVVDFMAEWCGPCRMLAPVIEQLATRYPGARFLKVDVDQCRATASSCGVKAMPTIQLYKQKQKVGEVVGADPAAIQRLIDAHYDAFAAFTGAPRKLTDGPAAAESTPAAAAAVGGASGSSEGLGQSGDCEVQIRLSTGEVLKGKFERTATLAQVRQFAAAGGAGMGFKLMLPGFPKKVYEEADMDKTLEEEQLAPRAQLIVCK